MLVGSMTFGIYHSYIATNIINEIIEKINYYFTKKIYEINQQI